MNKIIVLYGISNCDTVKKSRVWLTQNGIEYQFHDFKKHGVSDTMLTNWLNQVGWQKLLKKTGKTWACELSAEQKASLQDDDSALAMMLQFTNLIKRPVLEMNGRVLALGFKEAEYQNLLAELG
jgi:arsenate reductase